MNPVTYYFTLIFYQPLFNGLLWIYALLPYRDLGLAIVVFCFSLRLLLAPLFIKGQNAQKKMALLQPEMKKIQDQHKGNKEAQGRAMMELYAKHRTNPFSGCLPILIQLPILFALFTVFRDLKPENLIYLYSFVPKPSELDLITFGFFNLGEKNLFLGVLAGISQFLQTKISLPNVPQSSGGDFAKSLQWQALYIFPIFIFVWSLAMPAAMMFYWTVWNIFGILQEIITKRFTPLSPEGHK